MREELKRKEVAKGIVYSPRHGHAPVTNMDAFKALPKDIQELITERFPICYICFVPPMDAAVYLGDSGCEGKIRGDPLFLVS